MHVHVALNRLAHTKDYYNFRWRRLVRKRVGPDQVRVDICYITPSGRRLRTFPEIQNHLDASGEDLTLDHFTFSKKVDLGEVLDSKVSRGSVICVSLVSLFNNP